MPWASNEDQRAGVPAAGLRRGGHLLLAHSHPKPSAFERVIQALIFTAVIQAIAALLPGLVFPLPRSTSGRKLPGIPVGRSIAVILAFVVAVVNYDLPTAFSAGSASRGRTHFGVGLRLNRFPSCTCGSAAPLWMA